MLDKEKAIRITKNLIGIKDSVLDMKYFKSHEKFAILIHGQVIEVLGGDEKAIRYMKQVVPISNREYKEIHKLFTEEIKKRKGDIVSEKFDELESLIGGGNNNQAVENNIDDEAVNNDSNQEEQAG